MEMKPTLSRGFVSLVPPLRARLPPASQGEYHQATLRVVMASLVIVDLWVRAGASTASWHPSLVAGGVVGWWILAAGILAAVLIWPTPNAPRRVLGILVDAGIITFGLFLSGEAGVILFSFYLAITLGNGFRYGRSYLLVSQAACLAGFASVVIAAPWWRDRPSISLGLALSLITLPIYVSTLLRRVLDAHAEAERALRDCLERNRDQID
jgi:two-component system sensor histidine kinase RpfC